MFWVLIDPFWSNKTFRYHFTADRDYFPPLLVPVLRWVTLIVVMNQLNDTRGRREDRSRPGIIKWMRQSQEPFPVPMEYDPGPGCPGVILSLQWPMMSRGDIRWVMMSSGASDHVSSCRHHLMSALHIMATSLQVPGSRHHTEQEKLMTSDTGLWGRVIGLGSCHANRRYRVRGEAVSCGEPRLWRRGMLGRSGQMNPGMDHN